MARRKLYRQIFEDSITFSLDELKQVYLSQATWDENNQLTHLLGVSIENLSSYNSIVEDYTYQIPTKTCTYHTNWHYDQWRNQENSNKDNKDDSNLEDIISDIVDEFIDNNNNNNKSNIDLESIIKN